MGGREKQRMSFLFLFVQKSASSLNVQVDSNGYFLLSAGDQYKLELQLPFALSVHTSTARLHANDNVLLVFAPIDLDPGNNPVSLTGLQVYETQDKIVDVWKQLNVDEENIIPVQPINPTPAPTPSSTPSSSSSSSSSSPTTSNLKRSKDGSSSNNREESTYSKLYGEIYEKKILEEAEAQTGMTLRQQQQQRATQQTRSKRNDMCPCGKRSLVFFCLPPSLLPFPLLSFSPLSSFSTTILFLFRERKEVQKVSRQISENNSL